MTVKIIWASLNRLKQSNLFKFLLANALYSLSTALISIISPILYTNTVYESYIYIYQMVLFITGVTTAGLVPALLRYYKIDKSGNRRIAGTGIGLSIVKEILIAHGFRFGVTSNETEGTTFWIDFSI